MGVHDVEALTRLALAAKAGDRAAAGRFITATQPSVARFLSFLCDRQDVEDLTQETFLRAMRALPRFAARSTARTWLLAIARNVAADDVRLRQRTPRTVAVEDPEQEFSTVRHTGGRFEDRVVLTELLRCLSRERREAFIATQVLGLSYEEAAQICDCAVGTIRSRVARARDDLVTAWRGDEDVNPSASQPGHTLRRSG